MIGALIVLLFGLTVPAFAQGTAVPYTIPQYFDNNGDPLSGGRLCTFAAGTSTLATTYTTATLSQANDNPVVLNSAGRPSRSGSTVGIFLTPGTSYKLVLKDSTTTTCVPDTGVTIWSVDGISAVPTSSVNVDIPGTVGEDVIAGELLYLSDGSGSKTAGSWYRADADLSYAGPLPELGFAVNNIASGASGSIRIAGRVEGLSTLTPGAMYFASSTAGAITATPPTMARLVGQADSTTSLVVQPNPRSTPTKPRIPCGRLTLTTGVPVTTTDVTAATTLYYTPYGGCSNLTLYDGASNWYQQDFSQISIAVPATTNQMYDVFAYDNAGTLTLELTAWTNDTTRATALATQNGVYVKTGALTRLYLGSFRTTGVSGQTEDSGFACTTTKRYVWNYYNRVMRPLCRLESTASWTYTTATVRQANGSTDNQVDMVIGVAEDMFELGLSVLVVNATVSVNVSAGIGEGSTTTYAAGQWTQSNGYGSFIGTWLRKVPAIGRQFYSWNEWSTAGGTSTWYSAAAAVGSTVRSGLSGWVKG